MKASDLLALRLSSQLLQTGHEKNVQEVVRHLGAMQAQDYGMAKWAIGMRSGESEAVVDDAINSGAILRTHLLRPTWHFVAADDIHWMLELTAPQIRVPLLSASARLGLDAKALHKSIIVIEQLLSVHKSMTREEIMQELVKHHVPVDHLKPAHIMMFAEMEQLVCNGPMRGRQFTYMLLQERVGEPTGFTKEKALHDLSLRYFTSHGPATLSDFTWWSGLSVTNARVALESSKQQLESTETGGSVYWYRPQSIMAMNETVHLLPAFDEYLISYKDRIAAIDLKHQPKAFTKNGIFNPVILINGKAAGTWKRSFRKSKVVFECTPFAEFNKRAKRLIEIKAEEYAAFIGLDAEIRF
ncbi:winged helix DNA-binding domain-containing protein [Flavobacterium magnum]|uniref:Winged helix DNA-binding domain-containing protein n=1 Tax=Flavobacterium magnum TaxID=2162713 RepID=A0A2S0RGX2_9FLAO|nr:winged helix DNA-binding domain-containing protein [Flavobacterium magnum]AWA30540.1 winged helix DNA-binding domain-containing protein [Flavobacterium magnum]